MLRRPDVPHGFGVRGRVHIINVLERLDTNTRMRRYKGKEPMCSSTGLIMIEQHRDQEYAYFASGTMHEELQASNIIDHGCSEQP